MTPRTSTRTALAGAMGVVTLLALGACGQDDQGADAAVELTLPDAADQKCMMVNAEVLSQMDAAFEGTVVSIEGEEVTLDVERWFKGGDGATTVVVTQPDTAISEPVVEFRADRTYLVSATGDVVSGCGFTAPKDADLEAVYKEAFPDAG